jgi:hypothetical protein
MGAAISQSVMRLAYGLDDRGARVLFPLEANVRFSSITSRPALWPTQPLIQLMPTLVSQGLKWPGREADHYSPPTVDIKNGGVTTPLRYTSSWSGKRAKEQNYPCNRPWRPLWFWDFEVTLCRHGWLRYRVDDSVTTWVTPCKHLWLRDSADDFV